MASVRDVVVASPRDLIDRLARHSPARLAVSAFAAIVLLFTGLLSLPATTSSGHGAPLVDALFTATSAVCVTGLMVVPPSYWSTLGQVIILVGIKVGGLGVMTLASLLGMAVSRRLGLTQRLLAASETRATRLGEVGSLLRVVIIASTSIELAVAAVLLPRFVQIGEGLGEATWHAVFYAVSAFNNAGFSPNDAGLVAHVGDWWLGLPLVVAVFLGSLGFPVILNIARSRRGARRWSLHTKLTLTTSLALVAAGTVVIGAMEWANPRTLGPHDLSTKLIASLFAGVMPRSAGLNTVDISGMHEGTLLVTDALMFVGGGSASTAGGIKVTTLAVMLLAILAEARGDRDVEVYGKRIPRESLRLAVAVVFIGATTILVSCLLLLEITGLRLDVVLFEVVSAFATCGLSTGITAGLPDEGKYVLTALMFVGRTGTMTFAAALALRSRRRVIRLPEERPIIG